MLVQSQNQQLYRMELSARTKKSGTKKSATHRRSDHFVRWGWLEDNIFSRYSSYINNSNEILSAIRSIEPV